MAIIQCARNHYYDDSKDMVCPYCAGEDTAAKSGQGMEDQKTSYFPLEYTGEYEEEEQKTEAYGYGVGEYDKTIGIFTDGMENDKTAGWLVCMNGFMKGKSYVILEGRNFAGRSGEMDIGLSDDAAISRKNHFSIVYEPKSIQFYLVPGEGRTYLNGKAVIEACEIEEGDRITAGESNYVFVPFCREGRTWQ